MPRPHEKIEKSKDFKGSVKKILSSLKPWRVAIVTSFILAITAAIISIVTPNKLSDLTNYITDGLKPNLNEKTINKITNSTSIKQNDKIKFYTFLEESKTLDQNKMLEEMDNLPKSIKKEIEPMMDMKAIGEISLLLAILYVVSSLFNYVVSIIMANVTMKYAKDLRTKINKKIEKLPLKYFDHNETGDILSRITNDVDTLSINLSQSISGLVSNITLFLGSIVMMVYTNWIMALTGILASFIGFGFMFFILSKSQKYFVLKQEQLGDLNGYIEEMYSGHNVVVSYNGVEEVNKEFDIINYMIVVERVNSYQVLCHQ